MVTYRHVGNTECQLSVCEVVAAVRCEREIIIRQVFVCLCSLGEAFNGYIQNIDLGLYDSVVQGR